MSLSVGRKLVRVVSRVVGEGKPKKRRKKLSTDTITVFPALAAAKRKEDD